jgi:hypothetical protein
MSTRTKERKKKRQRRKKSRRSDLGGVALQKRMREKFGIRAVVRTGLKEKMSEIILEFAAPMLDIAPDDDAFQGALSTAIFAWNLACLPAHERKEFLTKALSDLETKDGDPRIFKKMIEELIQRKNYLYPDVKRFIFDYELTETYDGNHLYLISSPLSDSLG